MRQFLVALTASALVVAACGGASTATHTARPRSASASVSTRRPAPPRPRPAPPLYPRLLPSALGSLPTGFVPAVRWREQTAVWIARSRSGVALLSFDQQLLGLVLHSGTVDAGTVGWRYGPTIAGPERAHLIAAFNGGFKLDTGAGGFQSYGRTGSPLRAGLGSVVTYADGYTDIGSWQHELPAPGRAVVSVRQNLTLLIDHGAIAPTVYCLTCWGATLGGVNDPARSALGITADGHLVWAGGEHLSVGQLAGALFGARVVRAVELDINPEWVAAYLYGHRGGKGPLAPVPIVPAQPGVPGQFLAPYSRDFFTVVAR